MFGAILATIGGIAKKIPWQAWALLGLLLSFWWWGNHNYAAGQKERQDAWDASIKRGEVIVSKLKEDAKSITTVVVTEYKDRVTTIHEKGDEIIKKVNVYIPFASCELPGGFRLLHDAAASGTDPIGPEGTNAAPVPVRTAATTITSNYTTCHETAQRLISLQDWAVEVCQLYNKHLPKKLQSECIAPYEVRNKDN